ncbi:PAS domain-containing sensor histidine kinase [Spirosoma sp.]|uniref:PAS domain-containing sensor histidine kinase n=1 Tax=Spirosoma sp. TaxID=1899569 RepID=UPI003420144F
MLEEDRSLARQLLELYSSDGPSTKPLLLRFRHQTGDYRWFEVLLEVTRNAQQQVVGLTGTLTDRTEAQRAQEALFESEQRFRAIADNVEEIFWVRDVQQPLFQYINPSFERYTGLSSDTVYAHPLAFAQAVVEEDRPLVLEAFMSPQPRAALRFRVQHPDGQLRWLSTRIFTEKNQAGQLTRRMGMATDITAVVEKEQHLEASLAAERSLNALKSQFIATASHQFRTPLTAIKLSASLIQRYAHPTREAVSMPKIQKQVDTINRQVQALTELINDTLTLSRIEAGKVEVDLVVADLVALSVEVVGLFGDREDGRQVELSVEGEPVGVQVDKKLLSHVLLNLLSNAFKFSASNPQLTLIYSSDQVRILVSDRGVGIPQGDLPYLFTKFFRAANAGNIPGTGLGLAICQEYLTLQQASIEAVSQEGEGSVFTVTFRLLSS